MFGFVLSPTRIENPRVRTGIDLLDRHVPGWDRRINVQTLSVQTMDRCILGQLFGDYEHGKRTLGLGNGRDYGFTGHTDVDAVWRQEIVSRRQRITSASHGLLDSPIVWEVTA